MEVLTKTLLKMRITYILRKLISMEKINSVKDSFLDKMPKDMRTPINLHLAKHINKKELYSKLVLYIKC